MKLIGSAAKRKAAISAPAAVIKLVNRKLEDIIQEDLPILGKVKRFVVSSGGKRIRPLVHIYLSRISGYDGDECFDVGAIGEIVHAASLLHDDVVDDASSRRGKPTINAQMGNKAAILSGDYLLACAFDHLQTLSASDDLMAVFTRVIRLLAIGELLQLQWEGNVKMPESVYERIIKGKTGSLFGAMAEAGSILAGRASGRARCRDFGERLGRVFQIRDDYLDYFADSPSTGKERYQDFSRGLVTRPLIMIRKAASLTERRALDKIWNLDLTRRADTGSRIVMEIAETRKVQRRLATEIETEIHGLMHFVRNHQPSDHREGILKNIRSLSVAVS